MELRRASLIGWRAKSRGKRVRVRRLFWPAWLNWVIQMVNYICHRCKYLLAVAIGTYRCESWIIVTTKMRCQCEILWTWTKSKKYHIVASGGCRSCVEPCWDCILLFVWSQSHRLRDSEKSLSLSNSTSVNAFVSNSIATVTTYQLSSSTIGIRDYAHLPYSSPELSLLPQSN